MPACTAGIGGISYAAIYTTVLPTQGQGFELYAIAAAVIGGTSLAGGIGTIWGTIIGVFIMSVLATGLPALDLESHYQTFFTGIIVIGAVLLDMYRNKKAAEVRIETPADAYKASMASKVADLRAELASSRAAGESERAGGAPEGDRRDSRRGEDHLRQDEGRGVGRAIQDQGRGRGRPIAISRRWSGARSSRTRSRASDGTRDSRVGNRPERMSRA